METYAAIDIGSNAIRFGVAKVGPKSAGQDYEWINRYRIPLRLGAEVFSETKAISNNTTDYAIDAFAEFYRLMREYKVTKYFCGATSAFREAQNNNEFREVIAKKTNIQITGITGDEEAQIAMLGISKFLRLFDRKEIHHFLLADLGGGSLELDVIEAKECLARKSFKIGTVRLLNLYRQKGRDDQEVTQFLDHQFNKIQNFLEQSELFEKWQEGSCTIVGIGGNFRRLSKLKQRVYHSSDDFVLKDEIEPIQKQILEHDYINRIKHFGLKPDRADVIVPALDIISRLCNCMPVEKIYTPEQGLIDGLMMYLINESDQGLDLH